MGLLSGTAWDRPPHCARCERPEAECQCPPEAPASTLVPPEKQTARLSVERRKKGKTVTVIRGLTAAANDMPSLLTRLKNACGAGGAIEDDGLELQGDQLERLRKLLTDIGYKVRG